MATRFQEADAAVSPVIGTILMVAITVVLAGVAFVLFSGLVGDTADKPPALTMRTDEADDEAQVVHADTGLDWFRDMRVAGSCTPLLNGVAFPTAEGVPVRGGDVLTCESGENLQVSSSPGRGNALLFDKTFE